MTFINHGRYAHILRLTPNEAARIRELAEWFAQPSVDLADAATPGMNLRERVRELVLRHYAQFVYRHEVAELRVTLVTDDDVEHEVAIEDATLTIVPDLTAFQEAVARASEATERARRSLEHYRPPRADWNGRVELPRIPEPELSSSPVNFRVLEDGTIEALDDYVLRTADGQVVTHVPYDEDDFSVESDGAWLWSESVDVAADTDLDVVGTWEAGDNITDASRVELDFEFDWDVGYDYDADETRRRLANVEDTLAQAEAWESHWDNPNYAHHVDGPVDTRSLIDIPPEEPDPKPHLVNTGPGTGQWVACTPGCTVCGRP